MNLHKGEMARKNKLVKSTLSILLVLLLTITCMPITANASASATLDVVNIEVKPITIVAGTNGDYSYGYNPETDDYDLEYYYYYPQDIMAYTITLNDGTTISGTGYEFDYNGQTYSISSDINQDYENRWTVGTLIHLQYT